MMPRDDPAPDCPDLCFFVGSTVSFAMSIPIFASGFH
jgi:hypothetical protein